MDKTIIDLNQIKTVPELLEIWRQKHFSEGKVRFIYDGCADNDKYESSSIKIMIILKEGYFDEEDRNIPERKDKPWVQYFGNEGNQWFYHFEENLRKEKPWWMWVRINNLLIPFFAKLNIDYVDSPLQYISVVNLKKSKDNNGGGGSSEPNNANPYSNDKRVQEYAIEDYELLRRQIELHNPDIILCGGTYEMAKKAGLLGKEVNLIHKFDKVRGLRAIYNHEIVINNNAKGIKVVDMCHPTYSMSHIKVGNAIADYLL